MKRWDRVRFKYGSSVQTGTVLEIDDDFGSIRIRFYPWGITGQWMDMDSYHRLRVVGRSWTGQMLDALGDVS